MVGPNGEQVGIVRVEDALRLAEEADLDLVEVAPMAKPPVAKLMDFGKFKYEAAMKAREARKNQVNTVIKEIKLRPKIDPHDYGTKKGHVERFLKAGDKVKVTIMFRGREQSRPELGFRLLQRLAEDIAELGFVECGPKQDGRNMIMVIGPTKKKAEAKAEQRRTPRRSTTSARTGEPAPRPASRAARPQAAADRRGHRRRPRHGRRRPAGGGVAPGHDTPTRSPPSARTRRRSAAHAEDEDAQRCEEAVPGHRHRQGHARAGRRSPPARAQVDARRPAPSRATSSSPKPDAKKIKKLLGK